ncbi:unnamed protein product [Rotaria socialis]|nr:unnamed protein product [Rotaria socialis]
MLRIVMNPRHAPRNHNLCYAFQPYATPNINHLTSSSSSSSIPTLPPTTTSTSSSTTTTTTTTTIRASKLSPLENLAAVRGYTISSTTVTENFMILDEKISGYIKAVRSADDFQEFCTSYCTKLPRL